VSKATSKLESSVSVSSLTSDQIASNQPQNTSDVLSDIPGLFVQSSGGGGNANVSVRGLPISAGGSRYVQFQEDGLPVLMFGDIAFALLTISFVWTRPLTGWKWFAVVPARH